LELFRQAPLGVVPDEDAEAVPVEGHGQAVGCGEAVEQGERAVQVLGGPEVEGEDGPGRVVDGSEQQEGGAGAEPVELTAVDQDEGSHGGMPGPPRAVLPGPPAAFGGQAPAPAEAAEGTASEPEALDLAELLGAVRVIELPVRGLDELEDSVPDLDLQRPRGGSPSQPVHQAPDPPLLIAGLEPAKLADADVQGVSAVGIADLPGQGRLDQTGPGGLLATHRDGLPCLHGRTFLLNS
jgi:hypothetical protein